MCAQTLRGENPGSFALQKPASLSQRQDFRNQGVGDTAVQRPRLLACGAGAGGA
jgi:hypothetical protein